MTLPSQFRPMLAATIPCFKGTKTMPKPDDIIKDLKRLDWSHGFLVSSKVDGIRGTRISAIGTTEVVSRTLIPIRNAEVQTHLRGEPLLDGMDGELIRGTIEDNWEYNDNQSYIMSGDGGPDFTWNVFDICSSPNMSFDYRTKSTENLVNIISHPKVKYVPQVLCKTIDDLLEFANNEAEAGREGAIARHPKVGYKWGRSTFLQQGMFKFKHFVDAEARITGFEELMINGNEAKTDRLGYTKRSSHLSGRLAGNTLGRFVAEVLTGDYAGSEIRCGSGLSDGIRDSVWADRASYLGKVFKFKYQPVGTKDKPRSPIWLGWRTEEDM